jgi:hypothetical protein
MPSAKLVVIYPVPKDRETFERLYHDQHVPMAIKKLVGKTKIVATKVLSSAQGGPRAVSSRCRDPFPFNVSPTGVRREGRSKGDVSERRFHFDGRRADLHRCGRRNVHVLTQICDGLCCGPDFSAGGKLCRTPRSEIRTAVLSSCIAATQCGNAA